MQIVTTMARFALQAIIVPLAVLLLNLVLLEIIVLLPVTIQSHVLLELLPINSFPRLVIIVVWVLILIPQDFLCV